MIQRPATWIFHLSIQIAAVVSILMLGIGLLLNVQPLTTLFRSVIAFTTVTIIGWAASLSLGNDPVGEAGVKAKDKAKGINPLAPMEEKNADLDAALSKKSKTELD